MCSRSRWPEHSSTGSRGWRRPSPPRRSGLTGPPPPPPRGGTVAGDLLLEAAHHFLGLLGAALLEEPAGRLRQRAAPPEDHDYGQGAYDLHPAPSRIQVRDYKVAEERGEHE